jgi:hypothetical protein
MKATSQRCGSPAGSGGEVLVRVEQGVEAVLERGVATTVVAVSEHCGGQPGASVLYAFSYGCSAENRFDYPTRPGPTHCAGERCHSSG